MTDGTYSLADLCDLADVTPRTVRYYVSQGLLRSPGTSGPGARYDDGHLARLRLVRRLQREHLPLAEIRARLAALSDEEAIAQAEGPTEPPADSALDYVRGVLGARTTKGLPAGVPRPAALPSPSIPPPTVPSAGRPSPPPDRSSTSLLRRAAPALPPLPDASSEPEPPFAAARPSLPTPPGPQAEPSTAESPGAERSQWDRFVLAPDVELHVRRPLTRSQNRAVARLLEAARQLLEEDQP